MASFTYTARNRTGNLQHGTISAQTKEAAFTSLRQRNLQPIVVKPAGGSGLSLNIKLPGGSGVKPKDIVIFTRQFATMVGAGVPLLRALDTLREQTESENLKKALETVSVDVQGGGLLSDALGKHPKIFSDVYVNMVRAGEAAGILDQILNRLAAQVEKDSAIKGKLKGAMIYPAVILVVAIAAVSFLMVGVIPKLAEILTEAGTELPIQTRAVIGVSEFMQTKWYIIIAVVFIGLFVFRRVTSTKNGRYAFHKLLLKLPIFGKVILKVNVARFARTFSSLLVAGVSVIESLRVTSDALSNEVVKKALTDSIDLIRNGSTVSDSLAAANIMPQIIIQMAAVGEETGQLDTVLNKVAEFYEEEVDNVIAAISSIIEPIMIVSLGSVVGLIIASVLGPVSSLQGAIQ
jgi:type IV pilus assembly protein PilC